MNDNDVDDSDEGCDLVVRTAYMYEQLTHGFAVIRTALDHVQDPAAVQALHDDLPDVLDQLDSLLQSWAVETLNMSKVLH